MDVRLHTLVTHLDAQAKVLQTSQGDIPYDQCVLALGATPRRLDIEGAENAISVNHLRDYRRFRDQLPEGGRVVIIGAGLIGCEFANDLASSGHPVEVVDPTSGPLSRLVPPEVGGDLQGHLQQLGVKWHLERSVTSISDQRVVHLDDGTQLQADVILSAVGLQANTALAEAAGLKVDEGIAVDAHLQSSHPDVFALGDCASLEGQVRPFVQPLLDSAEVLTQTLCGQPTPLKIQDWKVNVKTPVYPLTITPVPRGLQGQWQVNGGEAVFHDETGEPRGQVICG